MNKTYRNVWNTATGTWTAVAETARSRSKGSARVARQAVAVLALGSASIGGAFAADVCTTEDGKAGSVDAAGVCKVTAPRTIGTDAIGTTATLTDNYIKVNSTSANLAAATGANAVAIGQAVASSGSSSVAIGSGTSADGLHSMALGASSSVIGDSNLAVGDGATVSRMTYTPTNAIAIGMGARVNDGGVNGATGSIAIGTGAAAGGSGAIMIGTSTRHSGSGATVVGANASAMGGGAGVAMGASSSAAGSSSVAMGPSATATGTGSIAIGNQAVTTNNNSMAIGNASTGGAVNATAIGSNAKAMGDNATVIGQSSSASGLSAVGIGFRANAQADGSVALGVDSVANRADTVSVGSASKQRQITNVAAGTAGTDAVNLNQMTSAIAAADNPYIQVLGATSGATAAVATGSAAMAIGNSASATATNTLALGAGSTASAIYGSAIGSGAKATGSGDIALGLNSLANHGSATSGQSSIAIGAYASSTGAGSIALGGSNTASGSNSVALGIFSSAGGTNSVALGVGSVTAADNTVSVGSATLKRQIVNVAAGTQATDAVNLSQLQPVVTALGGGATIDPTTGAVTGPTYTLTNGGTHTTVGGALGALDNSLSTATSNIARNTGAITTINTKLDGLSNGTIGLVQQSAAGANLTVGASTDGAAVDFTGTAGARKLTGVDAGAVSASSTDAVNGSQLHGVADSVASAIGGGSVVNADGSISAPSFTLGDGSGGSTTVRSVGSAITNLDGRVTTNEGDIASLADQIGSGTVGLVQQSAAGANITVGANTDGAAVDFTGTSGARTLTGVDAGTVSATSTDAVNGSQLHGMADSVASAIGGGSVVNADGSISAPSFTLGDGSGGTTTVTSVGGAITNLDGRVTTNEGDIASLADQIGNGTIGLVQQAGPGADITVGANTDGAAVDFTGTAGARKLTGVDAGAVSASSTDAVNGSQLHGVADSVASAIGGGSVVNADGSISAPSFTVGDGSGGTTTVTSVGGAITNLDGRVTTNEGDIASLADQIGSGTVGLVQQAGAGADITVGANTDGAAVDFTGTAGARKLTGVDAGAVSASSTDAVNGSQLHGVADSVASAIGGGSVVNADGSISAPSFTLGDGSGGTTTVRSVGDAVTNLDGRVTTNEGDIASLADQIGSGTVGLVQQAGAGANITVGANTDGAAVDFTGTAGARKLTGVDAGTVSASSTDAVNGSQLHGVADSVASAIGGGSVVNADGSISAPSFTLGDGSGGTTTIRSVGGAVTNLDGRVTTNEGAIASLADQIGNGTVGLVQQAGAGADITVGASTDGAAVDFAGTAGVRKLTGVDAGTVSATSADAVNGSQLHGVADSVASAIGGGSVVNADGSISAPTFTVGDGSGGTTTVRSVGDAVTNLDGRVTTNEGDIASLADQIGSGTVGLVQQAGAGANITVGANTDGAAVDFTGTAGARKLTGVDAGTVSASSTDAVNGSQLHGVADSVASAIGGGSVVNADGSISAPSFTLGDGSGGTTTVNSVGGAITNLDGRVTTNEGDIASLADQIGNGTVGLVQQAGPGADLTVGAHTDGMAVNFAGTMGNRTLSGVANGVNDDDAVTIAQLKATGLIDYTGKEIAAVTYDDISLASVTFGGSAGTTLLNVAPGLIAAGSMEAVNGGQLHDLQERFAQEYARLDGRVGELETGSGSGGGGGGGDGSGLVGPGTGGEGSLVVGGGAAASGENSSAIGQGSAASGDGSTAVGQGSNASGSNSSAIGQGAVASGSGGTAIGQGSNASGDNSTAIGQGSKATGNGSVAIGAGSVADRDDSVSVGSAGNERQITNVRAGTAPTDAVNVQQMNNAVSSARKDAMGGVAAAMAVAGLPQSTLPGRTFVAIAGSTYGGEVGSALGVSYMTRDGKWTIKAGATTSSRGEFGGVVGGGFYW
ncbi:ESPR-type extended signal peptide-containing protein [Burkholderia metallica]|uniref:ESPR-type extended signal peptide-containing protein n=1 Tax=Burkholderia metallica TaxID=488729 RepID=UPI00158A7556|nr:ESPR-type extended signal peptide-containing protein [Burkholderia metallica]